MSEIHNSLKSIYDEHQRKAVRCNFNACGCDYCEAYRRYDVDTFQHIDTFQQRVNPWMLECFGPKIAADKVERNHRFIEEALELVQACGASREDCHALVDYVYGRPQGDINQEVGGVMVTLASLCLANGLDMHRAGEIELQRIFQPDIIKKIRAKQAGKPNGSPLPQKAEQTTSTAWPELAYKLANLLTPYMLPRDGSHALAMAKCATYDIGILIQPFLKQPTITRIYQDGMPG